MSCTAFCRLVLVTSALAATWRPAVADGEYPNRPIRLLVGFAPGGGTDIYARTVAPKLADRLGQQLVVDNRAGAGGVIATALVAKAPPDGHTLLFISPSHVINPSLKKSLPFDPIADFEPVSTVAAGTVVLVVHPSLPAHSVKDLIALAKSKPGTIRFGSGGLGSSSQMNSEQFKSQAGIDIVHVPYKGTAAAIPDLVSGEVHMAVDTVAALLPHVRSGKLRALGVGDRVRSALLADVPTIAEAGLPNYEMYGGTGVLAPAKTPRAVISRLNREINAVLKEPDVIKRFTDLAVRPTGSTPEEFRQRIKADIARYAGIVKAAGIPVQ
ncbi:MAG: tripartite tricarboxylate transporter substrate binding protein [Burkholderiales bacterium]|nr:tripartite tricarboxylate transporter substrate binding protein [Burkholderiales bacterium]